VRPTMSVNTNKTQRTDCHQSATLGMFETKAERAMSDTASTKKEPATAENNRQHDEYNAENCRRSVCS
jgi:hypothetical protein